MLIHTENVTDIVFFIVCEKYIYFFGFIEALDSKGILNTLKNLAASISGGFEQLKRILWLFFWKRVMQFEEKLNIC